MTTRGVDRETAMTDASKVRIPADTVLFRPGDACRGLLLLESGALRVQLTAESGRQITLYRVVPDTACVLSTQCLMEGGPYLAEGVAETDLVGTLLSPSEVDRRLRDDPAFRRFLFHAYGTRLTDLVLLVEDLLETRIDRKLAQCLLAAAGGSGRVEATHHAIAAEIGTAREVVSRHLKDFERRGAVRLARGAVEIVRPDLLQRWSSVP
jgi:CRP/FNR family transcriptional regulator